MNIRPFGWRDIPLLISYRKQGLFLDSTRALIHGPALIPMGAFLPFLGPTTRIFTYRCVSPSTEPVIGQVTYAKGASYARLSFLAPENAMELHDLSALSDFMAVQMGSRGAFHILADIDESRPVYHLLHRAGFAVYARQRIWRLDGGAIGEADAVAWRASRSVDLLDIRSLYCDVVPGLVQQVEPLPKKSLKGFVQYHDGNLCAYVELKYGRYGIWVQPYVHPDAEGFDRQLLYLLRTLPGRRNRPLYICIRSYQSWLESAVEALGAQQGPRQAVMVRHLTIAQRAKQTYPLPAAMNGTHPEPTAPIARIDESQPMEFCEVEKRT
ncbi:MAG: hypothetical protein A2136_00570 [Chloroflexi bacterium RBG_16_54_11]|nr:MAG: hypothetical protein A2136_00570 [Chloroflexi bacterium RBG_16_54_11]